MVLGPAVGPLGRNALGGRTWEGFGADPYLQGVAARATTREIQKLGWWPPLNILLVMNKNTLGRLASTMEVDQFLNLLAATLMTVLCMRFICGRLPML